MLIALCTGTAISYQPIKLTNPMLQPGRARSSAKRFSRCHYTGFVALLALCVGMYFGISHSNTDGGCVKIASPTQTGKTVTKTPVSILLEYCQKNKLKEPEYMEVPAQNGSGFSYVVTVKGNSYNGIVRTKKQEAKHSAAKVAIQQLGISKNVM